MVSLSCPGGSLVTALSGSLGSVSVPLAPLALFSFEPGLLMHGGANSSILSLLNVSVVSLFEP